jgi:DNA invertase Pin-like site-specific DNA recombinase
MKIALYARVSTTDQSCDMQLHELDEYVARRGWQVFDRYIDTGFSGSLTNRPQIDRLLADARQRRFDAVLVWKLDRWGRSVAHCVRTIQELVAVEIRFLSVSEGIDTGQDNPMSRFMLHIFAAFAEMEREVIRERVRAGQRAAKAKGRALGRPKRLFRRDEALTLRNAGQSWRSIAKTLGIPMSTVIDACRSENPAKVEPAKRHKLKT